jgi:hypothetical protein
MYMDTSDIINKDGVYINLKICYSFYEIL